MKYLQKNINYIKNNNINLKTKMHKNSKRKINIKVGLYFICYYNLN